MKMPIIIKILFLACLAIIIMHADEKSLLETVKKIPLLHNGANFVEDEKSVYLVGVGKSHIRGDDVQAKINAIKEAQLFAQKAILSFTHGTELTVKEELAKTVITTTLVVDGVVVNNDKKRTRKNERFIRESGDGILVNLKKLGKWKESSKYFFAYYVLVP